MKPYYSKKGKFHDGRTRIVINIEGNGKKRVIHLPKPELLIEILERYRLDKIYEENQGDKKIG